ncbi:glycosyltransferase [Candidatus Zixiibacteriota bacterium]
MINVLLSTYNGTHYLPTLLDSLIAQDHPDITISIRDDGSTDGTPDILSTYSQKHDHISFSAGSNIGVNHSFFALLTNVSEEAEYVAFCDQDDFWQIDKISRAVGILADRGIDGPVMYCSRLTIADEHLKTIRLSSPPLRGTSFNNALVENIATGATVVLNRDAVELLTGNNPDIDKLEMYDWWIYQVLSALGEVVYDDQSRIISRQHGGNVVGLSYGLNRLRSKLNNARTGETSVITTQVQEFSRLFRDSLSSEDREVIDQYLVTVTDGNILNRTKYALSGRVYRQNALDDMLLRLRIISGRI